MSERRLSLIRHGRSSYVHPGGLMSARDMQLWREGYDAAGIVDDGPPAGLADFVAGADLVLASDLTRAIRSAERLTTTPLRISPLLREAPAVIPKWSRVRMPRAMWDLAVLVRWGYWIVRHVDPPAEDLARATRAANWLDDLSHDNQHIVVVTHNVFRRLLARQLENIGWHGDGKRRSFDHWSVWALGKPAAGG